MHSHLIPDDVLRNNPPIQDKDARIKMLETQLNLANARIDQLYGAIRRVALDAVPLLGQAQSALYQFEEKAAFNPSLGSYLEISQERLDVVIGAMKKTLKTYPGWDEAEDGDESDNSDSEEL